MLSISSFHGRGFFPARGSASAIPSPSSPPLEAVVGLFIELVFIATFSRRFFRKLILRLAYHHGVVNDTLAKAASPELLLPVV